MWDPKKYPLLAKYYDPNCTEIISYSPGNYPGNLESTKVLDIEHNLNIPDYFTDVEAAVQYWQYLKELYNIKLIEHNLEEEHKNSVDSNSEIVYKCESTETSHAIHSSSKSGTTNGSNA